MNRFSGNMTLQSSKYLLKSENNNGYFTQWLAWLVAYILSVTATYIYRSGKYMKYTQQRKIKHILCPQYFFISLIFSSINKSRYTKTKIWVLVSTQSLCCPTHFSHYFICFFMSYTEIFSIGQEQVQRTVW